MRVKIFGLSITRSAELASTEEIVGREVKNHLSDFFSTYGSTDLSPEGSLSISAVWACVKIISETIATLPVNVYQKTDAGRERLTNHPAAHLLTNPNAWQTKSQFFKTIIAHLLLWGNGYAVIQRDRFYRPIALVIYHPQKVTPTLTGGVLKYRVSGISGELDAWDVIHLRGLALDGLVGKSPIAVHRENLDLAVSSLKYGSEFFKRGGNTSGVYELPGMLDDAAYERLKKQLTERNFGLENAHKPLLLEDGLKYTRVNIPLDDAQFIATRKFQKNEIATIYGVPPHMIADLERSTNNNIEQQAIEFVTYCLRPYIVEIEEELHQKLFAERERPTHYVSSNLNALLRGDQAARSAYYRNLFYIGVFSQNEIRELEDMNAVEGGDDHFVQTNMTTVEKIQTNEPTK